MSSLREALEQELKNLPVVSYDDGYRVQALPKATLLDLLATHPDEPSSLVTAREPEGDDALERLRAYVAVAPYWDEVAGAWDRDAGVSRSLRVSDVKRLLVLVAALPLLKGAGS